MIKMQIQSRLKALNLDNLDRFVTINPGQNHPCFEIEAPFTGQIIGRLPQCSEADVDLAITQAQAAQQLWAGQPIEKRQAVFKRYHDLVLAQRGELLDLVQLEAGKARLHALEELFGVALTSRYYAYHGHKYLKTSRRRGVLPLLTRVREHRRPVGVVGLISPWNYPLILAVSDAIPALIAGNAVILKPSELTPYTALYAVKLLQQAGLPAHLFQVLTGLGQPVGPALVDQVDYVMFTGSTVTGRVVAQQAAGRLIPFSLELGGKNPMLVFEDANLEQAVEGAIRGAFSSTGQLCIAIERLYVQESVYDRFVARLLERIKQLKLGAAFDYSADVGSLVSQRQLELVHSHVQEALAKGAVRLTGGQPRPDIGPYFFEPTVLANVTEAMTLCREETFGPVMAIYPFCTVAEAVHQANNSAYGLNASIWTRDRKLAHQVARQIETGMVNINESYGATYASIDAPMGGLKHSGLGHRHGREGILKYTQPQTVASQHLIPLAPFWLLPAAAFTLVMTLLLLVFRRIPGLR
jgi:succinate-semialdehyde dehydrogenase/glutarate-semialdehyde dehydrogenase